MTEHERPPVISLCKSVATQSTVQITLLPSNIAPFFKPPG